MDDAALVAAARTGDRTAVAGIYDRYADRLHDFCHSILRDRDEAADALHDAFLIAVQRLYQLKDPTRLRPWLYAIARNEALRRAKARTRMAPTDEMAEVTSVDPGAERAVEEGELRDLVWAAAEGLSERDRVLLDLHLRQGLEGQELALAAGESPSNIYVLLSRLRQQVERSLGALLVARVGRRDCEELARLLRSWDGTYSPLIRKRIARHVDACEVCEDRRRTLASPLALLSTVPIVVAPAALRDRVLGDVEMVAHSGSSDDGPDGGPDDARLGDRGGRYDAEGFPKTPGRWSKKAMALTAVSAAVVGLLLAMALAGDEDPATVAVSDQATTTTTVASTTTSTVIVVPAADAPTIPTGAGVATSLSRSSPPGTAAPGPAGPLPLPDPPGPGNGDGDTGISPDDTGPVISAPVPDPSQISESGARTCSGPFVSAVAARVTDPSGVGSVSLGWTVGGRTSTKPMRRAGDTWSVELGPFPATTVSASTRIPLTVSATDTMGNTSRAGAFLTLVDCGSTAAG